MEAVDQEHAHISYYYTYTSNLYMYIVSTYLITFKLKFSYKLLLISLNYMQVGFSFARLVT